MTWKKRQIRPYRYPDQGWTIDKCKADAKEHFNPNFPNREGWRIWQFRYSRPGNKPTADPGDVETLQDLELPPYPSIDFHTHCWVDSFAPKLATIFEDRYSTTAHYSGTIDGLRQRKKELHVDKSVILPVPTNAKQVGIFNNWLQDYLDDPDIIPFMGIYHGMDDPVAEIHRCADLGFKGIKLHPIGQRFKMADPKMFPIYEAAIERDMILLFHTGSGFDYDLTGTDWDCSRREIDRYFEKFPYEKTVLAHLGGPSDHFAKPPFPDPSWPGYLDTAFVLGHIPDELFLEIVESFGAKRVLFGTDAPWDSTRDFLIRMNYMGLKDEDLKNILYNNAAELLHLPLL